VLILAVPGLTDRSAGVLLYLAAVGFIAGLARGFSGFGSAMIFVPLASVVVEPMLAAPILTILDGMGALPMLPAAWRNADRRGVFILSLGAMLAIPVGVWTLVRTDPVALRWGLSIAILILVGWLASGWRFGDRPRGAVTLAAGVVSGLLTGAAQIGGPPAVAYWLSGAASAAQVRANMVLFLALSQSYALVAYGFAGLFNPAVAGLAVGAVPGFLAGVAIGSRMFGLASPETFRRICFCLIAVAAIVSMPVLR
jgi:uncharacterized membrane protein YfcA